MLPTPLLRSLIGPSQPEIELLWLQFKRKRRFLVVHFTLDDDLFVQGSEQFGAEAGEQAA